MWRQNFTHELSVHGVNTTTRHEHGPCGAHSTRDPTCTACPCMVSLHLNLWSAFKTRKGLRVSLPPKIRASTCLKHSCPMYMVNVELSRGLHAVLSEFSDMIQVCGGLHCCMLKSVLLTSMHRDPCGDAPPTPTIQASTVRAQLPCTERSCAAYYDVPTHVQIARHFFPCGAQLVHLPRRHRLAGRERAHDAGDACACKVLAYRCASQVGPSSAYAAREMPYFCAMQHLYGDDGLAIRCVR